MKQILASLILLFSAGSVSLAVANTAIANTAIANTAIAPVQLMLLMLSQRAWRNPPPDRLVCLRQLPHWR